MLERLAPEDAQEAASLIVAAMNKMTFYSEEVSLSEALKVVVAELTPEELEGTLGLIVTAINTNLNAHKELAETAKAAL